MIEILALAVASGVGAYLALGVGLYFVFSWMEDEPFESREFLMFILTWPTMLFG